MRKLFLLVLVLSLAAVAVSATGRPERPPLGTEENPLVWSFVPSGDTTQIIAGGQAVADMIFQRTGVVVRASVATEYAGVIEALSTNPPTAHMTSLATFAYVMAADRGVAQAALVSVRNGRPFYDGQIIASVASGIRTLADLRGKTFARPDPLSTSGWIIPALTIRGAGVNPDTDLRRVVDAGGHPAVVTAVYNGDADAGATFVDARANVQRDLPDVMEKVIVVQVSAPIPNDGVQFHPSVPADTREKVVAALLEIIKTEAGLAAFRQAYQWTALERHGDDFYDPFRQVLQAAGVSAESLMRR